MVLGVNGIRLVANRGGVARMIEAVPRLGELDHPHGCASTPKPLDPVVRLPAVARNVVLPSRLPAGWREQIVLPLRMDRTTCSFVRVT